MFLPSALRNLTYMLYIYEGKIRKARINVVGLLDWVRCNKYALCLSGHVGVFFSLHLHAPIPNFTVTLLEIQ